MTRVAAVCLGRMTFGYETALGVRVSRDPLAEKGGLNMYAFVRNNSATYIDALGRNYINLNDSQAVHGNGHSAIDSNEMTPGKPSEEGRSTSIPSV